MTAVLVVLGIALLALPGAASAADDVTPPDAPILLAFDPAPPSQELLPLVTGIAEPGSFILLYRDAACTAPYPGWGTAEELAAPGMSVSVDQNATSLVYATATDEAGNVSACGGGLSYLNDTEPPNGPVFSAVSPASPSPDRHPRVTGTAEAGSTVWLYDNEECAGDPIGTGTAEELASTGVLATVAADATTSFYGRAVDVVGNASFCAGGMLEYVNDTIAPDAPTLVSIPASPSRSYYPDITGTAEETATVRLYTAAGCTGPVLAEGTGGAFEVNHFGITVSANTTTRIYATATDEAGNVSACAGPLVYVNDRTAPSAPIGLASSPASPGATLTPAITGTAEAGSTVRLYGGGACTGTVRGTGTAAAFASSGLGVTVTANSTTTFSATATDAAGNVSGCSSSKVTYVNDRVAPAAPTLTGTTPGSPSTDRSPVVRGTAEAASTVRLYATDGCIGSPLATGTAAAFASPGLSVTVDVGSTTTVRATATDVAGNVSACSTAGVTYVHLPPTSVSAATGVTAAGATLHGYLADGVTGYQFLYRKLGVTAWTATAKVPAGERGAVSQTLAGLDPLSVYYVKLRPYPLVDGAYAYTSTISFTTAAAAPAALVVDPVTDLTETGATLGVTVDTGGAATSGVVEWGTADGDYTRSAALYGAGPADARTLARNLPTQFAPGTTYHYRVTVTNAGGSRTTADHTFTTLAPAAPGVTIGAVDPLAGTTATINAVLDLHGAAYVAGTVQWGTTTEYGRSLPLLAGATTTGGRAYTRPLISLKPGTTYHYRVTVTSAAGTYESTDRTFTTSPALPPG